MSTNLSEDRDPFAFGGKQEDELLNFEAELLALRPRAEAAVISNATDADHLLIKCALLERRICLTPPKTAAGAGVVLRHVIRIENDGWEISADEIIALRQVIAFIETVQ